MTLAQLASYVCTKSGLTDTAAVTACKTFLSKRYELIWNSALWKDSLIGVDVTVDPSDADNAEGIVFLPEVIDRVVAVRTVERSVQVRGLEDYYRIDFDKFSQTGTAFEFAILSPAWFVWRSPSADQTGLGLTASADATAKIIWFDQNGVRHVESGTGTYFGTRLMTGTKITVESLFVDSDDPIAVFPNNDTNLDNVGEIIPPETRSPSYQRLRIFNIPDAAITLSVLGKKKFIPFDFDNEEPELKNLDNCLIAFGMAEMLQYGRRVGQAQTFLQEAEILLKELARLETVQAAHNSRFVPESGFGDPFFNPSTNAGFTTGVF
jgi:hypothetical protein